VRRAALSILTPVILGVMARMMLAPPADLRRHCRVPRSVARAANRSPEGRAQLRDSVAKTRKLWVGLGLVNPVSRRIWKLAGIWDTVPERAQPVAATV
jgi:hypothetical protein